jgi:hypothetical protein
MRHLWRRWGRSSSLIVHVLACLLFLLPTQIRLPEAASPKDNACTKALPQSLRKALTEDLCGPQSPGHSGPAECASAARKELPSWHATVIADLCRGASGPAPARCARSFQRGAPQALQVSLCRPLGGVRVLDRPGPAAPSSSTSVDSNIEALLAAPARCYGMLPKSWPAADAVTLCSSHGRVGSSPSLLSAASLNSPAQCALEVLHHPKLKAWLSSSITAALCRNAPSAAATSGGDSGPVACAATLLSTMAASSKAFATDRERSDLQQTGEQQQYQQQLTHPLVRLCQGAADDAPAQCLAAVRGPGASVMGVDTHRVDLCEGARGPGPAQCAARIGSDPDLADPELRVRLCRGAQPVSHPSAQPVTKRGRLSTPSALALSPPAECFRATRAALKKSSSSSLSASASLFDGSSNSNAVLRVSLCAGVTDAEPLINCVAAAPYRLDPAARAVLCAGAGAGKAEVTASRREAASGANKMRYGEGPAECLKSLRTLQYDRSGSISPTPFSSTFLAPGLATMAAVMRFSHELSEALKLCAGAGGSGPADCFEASPRDLELSERVALCNGAVGTAPADCAARCHHRVSHAVEVAVCHGVAYLPPPATAPSSGDGSGVGRRILRPSSRRGASGGSGVVDEAATSYGGPADCALAALRGNGGFKDDDLVLLCRGGDVRAASCAAHPSLVQSPLDSRQRAGLCARATSNLPAACAAIAPVKAIVRSSFTLLSAAAMSPPLPSVSSSGGDLVVDLCSGASSVAPGACANFVVKQELRSLDESTMRYCKHATPVPSGVTIREMWWDVDTSSLSSSSSPSSMPSVAFSAGSKPGLFARRNVHVTMDILDQFGYPMSQYSPDDGASRSSGSDSIGVGGGGNATMDVFVVASIDAARSDGGALEGIRSNFSRGGAVEFHFLRFSRAGTYDLRFALKGEAHVETVRVKVEEHEDDRLGPLGQCGQMLHPFLSSFDRRGGGARGSSSHDDESTLTVAMLKWPHALDLALTPSEASAASLFVDGAAELTADGSGGKDQRNSRRESGMLSKGFIGCRSLLAEAGFKVVEGWGGDLWLWYRPAVVALDTGEGLPLPSMDSWERLGLENPAHRKEQHSPKANTAAAAAVAAAVHPQAMSTAAPSRTSRRPSASSAPSYLPHHAANDTTAGVTGSSDNDAGNARHLSPRAIERLIRKAYYRHSLIWHPDRWASYPRVFQRRAQDSFELISDAYRHLTTELV